MTKQSKQKAKQRAEFNSEFMQSMYEAAEALRGVGAISDAELRQLDRECTPRPGRRQ